MTEPDGTHRCLVPANLPRPRCTFCGGEIRDLTMGLLIWNDGSEPNKPFDGLHFAHKLECDPG